MRDVSHSLTHIPSSTPLHGTDGAERLAALPDMGSHDAASDSTTIASTRLFEVIDSVDDADAIVYLADGDSSALNVDVKRANDAGHCIPIIFYLTNDRDYAPEVCKTALL